MLKRLPLLLFSISVKYLEEIRVFYHKGPFTYVTHF